MLGCNGLEDFLALSWPQFAESTVLGQSFKLVLLVALLPRFYLFNTCRLLLVNFL